MMKRTERMYSLSLICMMKRTERMYSVHIVAKYTTLKHILHVVLPRPIIKFPGPEVNKDYVLARFVHCTL